MSPKLLSRKVLQSLRARGIDVDAIYLFGSHARGEARAESDIDFLVVSGSLRRKSLWSWCGIAGQAMGEIREPVQVYPVTPEEFARPEPGGFIEAITPDLKPLYRRARSRRSVRTLKANRPKRRVAAR